MGDASKVPADPNMTTEVRDFLDATVKTADQAAIDLAAAIAALPSLASQAEAEAGTDNVKYMSALRVAQAIAALTTPSVFTVSFTSTDQTITAAGQLTLPHSLGAAPKLVQARLKNVSTEANYAANDEIIVSFEGVTNTKGCTLVPDATNITVSFGSSASTFSVLDKSTGNVVALTNNKWSLIVRAWA